MARANRFLCLILIAATGALDTGRKQVYIVRHCVRRTGAIIADTGTPFSQPSDFTSQPVAEWPAPPFWCAGQGALDILQGSGADLRDRFIPRNTTDIRVIADTMMRDGDTALSLLRGLGDATVPFSYRPGLFKSLTPDMPPALCHTNSTDIQVQASVQARLAQLPMPADYNSTVALLQSAIGVGRAGDIRDMPPVSVAPNGQTLLGGMNVLRFFVQELFYSWAANVSYAARGKLSEDDLYELMQWQHWYRAVVNLNPYWATQNAALLHSAMLDLQEPGAHSTLYVGHDSNQDGFATLLDAQWDAPPFKGGEQLLPTPPGSALQIEYDPVSDRVSASFLYANFTGSGSSSDGVLKQRTVEGLDGITMQQLQARVDRGIATNSEAAACYHKEI